MNTHLEPICDPLHEPTDGTKGVFSTMEVKTENKQSYDEEKAAFETIKFVLDVKGRQKNNNPVAVRIGNAVDRHMGLTIKKFIRYCNNNGHSVLRFPITKWNMREEIQKQWSDNVVFVDPVTKEVVEGCSLWKSPMRGQFMDADAFVGAMLFFARDIDCVVSRVREMGKGETPDCDCAIKTVFKERKRSTSSVRVFVNKDWKLSINTALRPDKVTIDLMSDAGYVCLSTLTGSEEKSTPNSIWRRLLKLLGNNANLIEHPLTLPASKKGWRTYQLDNTEHTFQNIVEKREKYPQVYAVAQVLLGHFKAQCAGEKVVGEAPMEITDSMSDDSDDCLFVETE